MTKGEAKQLESDVVIFPLDDEGNNRKILLTKKAAEDVSTKETSVKIDLENRFARLRKSLRKRSASIL